MALDGQDWTYPLRAMHSAHLIRAHLRFPGHVLFEFEHCFSSCGCFAPLVFVQVARVLLLRYALTVRSGGKKKKRKGELKFGMHTMT
jgi:hypothetical protein